MALGLFRFIAALGRTQVVANTLGTFTILLVFVLGGFIIAKDDLHPWMKWAYYLSPMSYGQNAIVLVEFLDPRWSAAIGTGFCVLALFGFSLVFNIFFVLVLTFLTPMVDSKSVADDINKKKKLVEMGTSESNIMSKKGMVLPFKPLSLAFNHLNYYVDMPAALFLLSLINVVEEKQWLEGLRELYGLTGNFRPSVAYGSYAGSSTLYKGWIDEQYAPGKFGIGIPIAIKRLKQSLQGDKEWLGFFVPSNIPSGVSRRLFSPLLWESESAYHWTVIKDMGKVPPAYIFAAFIPALMIAGQMRKIDYN
ncbi:pleiotropic drug resistance protein 2 [Artemisia annua]|uniref:Pleiotropic drug resistance protein 2 n=1 Tax=Artemisia annua TaxID=35608 RepID=A0A2U1QP30_ARTAN|nr:pleiotropic drug resistance protein 2 [Artemisia annua]